MNSNAWARLLAAVLLAPAPAGAVEIQHRDGAIEATGLPEAEIATAALSLRVESEDALPTIAGRTESMENGLRFVPAFPLARGLPYRATLERPGSEPVVSMVTIPRAERGPSAAVTAVYPKADVLPENLLKFYIHFSAPMRSGGNYRHIRLFDAGGKAVDLPFLELDEELWDPDHRRLTVFLDPARIKRGLKPHEDVGRAIRSGNTYTLVINRGFEDAHRTPLRAAYRKTFRVAEPDYDQPSLKDWKIAPPPAGTKVPLIIDLGEPLDHGLLLRLVTIENTPGEILATKSESVWQFVPDLPWKAGKHRILVGTLLEDFAGNSLQRPFEVVPGEPFLQNLKETETLSFEVEEVKPDARKSVSSLGDSRECD